MATVYQRLLRLYPATYREHFGEEMLDVFRAARADVQTKTLTAQLVFCAREFVGVVRGAASEHLHNLIGTELHNWRRRFTMRDGFRFPKTTAVLMLVILAGVVIAIKRGEDLATSLPRLDPQIAPVHSMPSSLLAVVMFLLFFYAAGLIAWLILYAMRRSGLHRLDEMASQPK
jgi:hypothetical protein